MGERLSNCLDRFAHSITMTALGSNESRPAALSHEGEAMSEQFKPGDVVRLKSGGPMMTVAHVGDDEIYCEWFDDKKEPQGRGFSPVSLKLAGSDAVGSARVYRA